MSITRFFLIAFFCGFSAQALDAFETQVYDAGINEVGKRSLEVHLNNVVEGRKVPEYPEQIPANKLSHITFEFALGLTESWELGAYLQTVITPETQYKYAGVKLRSKFVVPKSISGAYQFGANFEISDVPKPFELIRYGGEIRPIFGYTHKDWTFLTNPILGFNLSDDYSTNPSFSPASKFVYDTHLGYGLGLEYYVDFGAAQHMEPLSTSEQYVYANYDKLKGSFELNIGIGKGLNSQSNSTLIKSIIGCEF